VTRFLNVDSGSPSSCLTRVLTRRAGVGSGPPQPFPHELLLGVGERVPESGVPSPGSFPSWPSPHPLIHIIRVCEDLRKALLPHPRGVHWRWRQAGPGRCCRWGVPLVHEGGPPVLGERNDRFRHGQCWQRLLSRNQRVYRARL